jgi:hypothetical protein
LNELVNDLRNFIAAGNEILRSANDTLAKLQKFTTLNFVPSRAILGHSTASNLGNVEPLLASGLVPAAAPTSLSSCISTGLPPSAAHGEADHTYGEPGKTQPVLVSRELTQTTSKSDAIETTGINNVLIKHSFKGMCPPRLEFGLMFDFSGALFTLIVEPSWVSWVAQFAALKSSTLVSLVPINKPRPLQLESNHNEMPSGNVTTLYKRLRARS